MVASLSVPAFARLGLPLMPLACAAYFGLAVIAMHLTAGGHNIATLWAANASLLALLLRGERTRWGSLLLAGFIGNLSAGILMNRSFTGPPFYAVINMVEVSVAAFFLRRAKAFDAPLGHPQSVLHFIFWAGLVAPGISATAGALIPWLFYGHAYLPSFKTWFWADSLGLLIFTPFFLDLLNGEYRRFIQDRSIAARLELVALQLLVVVVALIVFTAKVTMLFILFPPVLLVSFRVGRLGTQLAVLFIATIGTVATMKGAGPIVLMAGTTVQQTQFLQFFLAVLLLTCLPVTAGLSARVALASRLSEDARALQEDRARLAIRAVTDPLTGLLNRAGFLAAAEKSMAEATAAPHWMVAIDIDYFKGVNDRLGHDAGDEALLFIAGALRSALRHQDVIGRLGGDEFMILLPSSTELEARKVCGRLVSTVQARPLIVAGAPLNLSISCGAVPAPAILSLKDVMRDADRALYEAKGAGRNQAVIAA